MKCKPVVKKGCIYRGKPGHQYTNPTKSQAFSEKPWFQGFQNIPTHKSRGLWSFCGYEGSSPTTSRRLQKRILKWAWLGKTGLRLEMVAAFGCHFKPPKKMGTLNENTHPNALDVQVPHPQQKGKEEKKCLRMSPLHPRNPFRSFTPLVGNPSFWLQALGYLQNQLNGTGFERSG